MNKIFTKSTLVLLLIAGGITTVSAQQPKPKVFQKIGKNPYELDASAALEIDSDNKGFLLTPLDNDKVQAIKTAAQGLVVYNAAEGLQVNTAVGAVPEWSTVVSSKVATRTGTTTVKEDYSLKGTDGTVWVDATTLPAGKKTITLTLPTLGVADDGKTYIVGKIDDSSNSVTFSPPLKVNNPASKTSISTLNYSRSFRIQSLTQDKVNYWYIID